MEVSTIEKGNKELVSRLSHEVLEEVAPDELDLFDDIKEEFIKNPDGFLEKDSKKREEMLGFAGAAGGAELVTTVVLPIVSDVVKKYLSKKLAGGINKDMIKKVRDEAYNNAITMGMSKKKAELMADSLVGKLVLLG